MCGPVCLSVRESPTSLGNEALLRDKYHCNTNIRTLSWSPYLACRKSTLSVDCLCIILQACMRCYLCRVSRGAQFTTRAINNILICVKVQHYIRSTPSAPSYSDLSTVIYLSRISFRYLFEALSMAEPTVVKAVIYWRPGKSPKHFRDEETHKRISKIAAANVALEGYSEMTIW